MPIVEGRSEKRGQRKVVRVKKDRSREGKYVIDNPMYRGGPVTKKVPVVVNKRPPYKSGGGFSDQHLINLAPKNRATQRGGGYSDQHLYHQADKAKKGKTGKGQRPSSGSQSGTSSINSGPSLPHQHTTGAGKVTTKPLPKPTLFPGPKNTLSAIDQERADRQRAEDLVNMQYDPMVNELKRQLELIRTDRDQDISVQERYAGLGDDRIAAIYSDLQKQLSGYQGDIRGIYDRARGITGGAYDEATKAVQGATGEAQRAMESDAQRLGIEEGLSDPLAKLTTEMSAINARNKSMRAGAVGNFANLGADMEALAVRDQMNAGREGAQERANLANIVAKNIGDIQSLAAEAMYNNYGELADIAQVRGAALRTAYQEVVEARTDRERQEKLDRLAEEIQRNTMVLQNRAMDLQEKQFGLQTEESLFNRNIQSQQLQMQKDQFELQKQQLQAQIAAANSPEAKLAAQLELQKVQAEIDKINAQTGLYGAQTVSELTGGAGSNRYRGHEGVVQWANNQGYGQEFANQALKIIQDAMARGGNDWQGSAMRMIDSGIGPAAGIRPEAIPIFKAAIAVYAGDYSSYAS